MARVTILVFSALLVLYMQIENANSNMLAKQIKKKKLPREISTLSMRQPILFRRQISNYKRGP